MNKATGTLSRDEFVRAAVTINEFAVALKNEFGVQAEPLLTALRVGAHHELRDQADDLLMDVLKNDAEVLASFAARDSEDDYPIEVKGIRPLRFVWAPEFGSTGPFPSIELAKSFLVYNWTDSLISASPDPSRPSPDGVTAAPSQAVTDAWERRLEKLNARLRASGRTVTVMEPSDATEFVVTFPQGRLPKERRSGTKAES